MQTIMIWYRDGGVMILPLVLTGVIGLALLVERIARIAGRMRVHARPFMEKVLSLTRAGKIDDALALCADHQAALADLGLVILRSRSSDEQELRTLADAAKLSVTPLMARRVSWLPTLAHAAMLLGALGAIWNLHDALSGGVDMNGAMIFALRPLGVGILTAIPLRVGHAYVAAAAAKLAWQLDEFSARLIGAVLGKGDIRLGHRD